MKFNIDILKIDPEVETKRVADFVADQTKNVFRRSGVVVGLSGGIDSAVMAAIAVRAVGREHVTGLILPEKESNPGKQFLCRQACKGTRHRLSRGGHNPHRGQCWRI